MHWWDLRIRFLLAVLALIVSGALVVVVMLLGEATLADLWSNMFGTFVFVFVTSLASTAYLLLSGKWKKHRAFSAFELKQYRANLNRFREQPRRDELHDQLKLVYRPLMHAVQEMKQGKDTLPKAGSVGNYNNPWTRDPKIIAQVVDIFDKHFPLVENEVVRKGWEENRDCLRKGEFLYGKKQREWLENIERQHTLINWWLHSP